MEGRAAPPRSRLVRHVLRRARVFPVPSLLAALYPGAGEVDDHESLALSPTAHKIARALVAEPLPSAVLRRLVDNRNRYQRAIVDCTATCW